ncbi:MAG: helix-turn-helix transcriptional regulator [Treponema sp.]|nr:helix-turn-helix transcriptional regulator [Treponema sp.]
MNEAEELRKVLSGNIKTKRKKLGLSQEKLAERTELSTQTINDIEGRRMWVSDKTLVKLAHALDMKAYELLLPSEAEFKSEPLLSLRENLKKGLDLVDQALDLGKTFKPIV